MSEEFKRLYWATTLGVATASVIITPLMAVAVHKIGAFLAARRARAVPVG